MRWSVPSTSVAVKLPCRLGRYVVQMAAVVPTVATSHATTPEATSARGGNERRAALQPPTRTTTTSSAPRANRPTTSMPASRIAAASSSGPGRRVEREMPGRESTSAMSARTWGTRVDAGGDPGEGDDGVAEGGARDELAGACGRRVQRHRGLVVAGLCGDRCHLRRRDAGRGAHCGEDDGAEHVAHRARPDPVPRRPPHPHRRGERPQHGHRGDDPLVASERVAPEADGEGGDRGEERGTRRPRDRTGQHRRTVVPRREQRPEREEHEGQGGGHQVGGRRLPPGGQRQHGDRQRGQAAGRQGHPPGRPRCAEEGAGEDVPDPGDDERGSSSATGAGCRWRRGRSPTPSVRRSPAPARPPRSSRR